MSDESEVPLLGRCLLVVEDEYLVATDLAQFLTSLGAEVIGPAGSVETALDLLGRFGDGLNGAVLDVNLGGRLVFPVRHVRSVRRGSALRKTSGRGQAGADSASDERTSHLLILQRQGPGKPSSTAV